MGIHATKYDIIAAGPWAGQQCASHFMGGIFSGSSFFFLNCGFRFRFSLMDRVAGRIWDANEEHMDGWMDAHVRDGGWI